MSHRLAAMVVRAPLAGALLLLLTAGSAAPALAQDGPGLRGGLSADPDQFFVGAHYVTQPISGMLRFQPNVEAGFGEDLTTIAFNGEFALWRKVSPDWHAYFGGGPSMNVYRFTTRSTTNTEVGFDVVAGMRYRTGLFFELKIGTLDSPSFKMLVGYTIR